MSIAMPWQAWHCDNEDYEPVSDSSQALQKAWQKQKDYLRSSATDWLPSVYGALNSMRDECREADWDCEGALPVRDCTIDLAARISAALFDSLPKGIPAPDVIPEQDGEICISWVVDSVRVFSLSIGEHGNMNFAGQFGKEGGVHAWQPIDEASSAGLQESLVDVVR